MIPFEIGGLVLIAFLWFLGGQKWSWARDFIIPIIVGVFVFLHHPTHVLWKDIVIGVFTIAFCNIIRMGYGAYDPEHDDKPSFLAEITSDRDGWNIRCIYGAICGIVSWIPQIAIDFDWITLVKAITFTAQFALVCFIVVRLRLNVFVTDICIGASFAVRLFL